MQSLHSNRAPFRFHVSLAATLFLAACGGQPSKVKEGAACSGGEKSQGERQKATVIACELATQEEACQTALEELACESSDSRNPEPKEQLAHDDVGQPDLSSVTSALAGNCPSTLSGVTTSGSCYCPPMTTFGSLWGTGVYTSDSHLCTAAVHSGVISASTGGDVSYTMFPGRSAYCGSTRNGVTSRTYGSYSASYSVGGAEIVPVVTKESVSHAYSARHISTNTTRTFTAGAGCLLKPVSIVYVSDNDGDLLAVGADGTRVVIDSAWLPNWDSYSPISTARTDCAATCPAN
jgi:LCCL domain